MTQKETDKPDILKEHEETDLEKQESALKLLLALEEKAKLLNIPANLRADIFGFNIESQDGGIDQRIIRINPVFLDLEGKIKVATVNLYSAILDEHNNLYLNGIQEIVIIREQDKIQVEHSAVDPNYKDNFGTVQILEKAASRVIRTTMNEVQISSSRNQAIPVSPGYSTKIQ